MHPRTVPGSQRVGAPTEPADQRLSRLAGAQRDQTARFKRGRRTGIPTNIRSGVREPR